MGTEANANGRVATTLEKAAVVLDGYKKLAPGTPDYDHFYVDRPNVNPALIRESRSAAHSDRPFHWFYTGHTGSGKSTELNRIMTDSSLRKDYLPTYVDIEESFDIRNIEYTDIILAMSKACAQTAAEIGCGVPKELVRNIKNWGADILTEEEIKTITEGKAGVGVSLGLFSFGEIIKSGGTKRELIRRNVGNDITRFIAQLDELTALIAAHSGLRPLCVIDGLDHMDAQPCYEVLNSHFVTVMKPQVSKLVVIPLPLLNTDFATNIEGRYSMLSNIRVFKSPVSAEIDEDGFEFCRHVIGRYASLSLFTDEALRSLFTLSAGMVRDMIRYSGEACGRALDGGATRVELEHAEKIWYGVMGYYRSMLLADDFDVLREVLGNPYPKGIDGVARLLHRKAIVVYPNSEQWYGVHPAIRRILDDAG